MLAEEYINLCFRWKLSPVTTATPELLMDLMSCHGLGRSWVKAIKYISLPRINDTFEEVELKVSNLHKYFYKDTFGCLFSIGSFINFFMEEFLNCKISILEETYSSYKDKSLT